MPLSALSTVEAAVRKLLPSPRSVGDVTNDYPGDDINQLLLQLLGSFAHLQLLIEDVLAKNYFERRTPKAAEFLMKRVVSRIRDSERTKLVQVIADEYDSPAELDNFSQVYTEVKRLRDTVAHSVIRSGSDGVLHIIDSYSERKPVGTASTQSMGSGTLDRSQVDEAVRKCRWLEAQIYYLLDSTGLALGFVKAGRRMKVVKPPRKFRDWDGDLGLLDDGPYEA